MGNDLSTALRSLRICRTSGSRSLAERLADCAGPTLSLTNANIDDEGVAAVVDMLLEQVNDASNTP